MVRRSGYAASATLAAIAGLHIAWGVGSSFPFRSREELAIGVIGGPEVPSAVACHSVAAALVIASGLAADLPVGSRRLRSFGRAGVAGVLAIRGALGLLGRTDAVSPGSSSPKFRRLDRRLYAPLCLLLSVATATANERH